ncbi:MAG: Maf family protein [Actinomycetota bacterium]|nr:Maf family protein [Actinomycetota bacterium]
MSDFSVILASGSPQRREILGRLGVEFEVRVSGAEELVHGDPAEIVVANALLKAESVAGRARTGPGPAAEGSPESVGTGPGPAVGGGPDRPELVIGCDTDVVLEDHIIGKPEDEIRAREYMAQLSGREHRVLSGLAVLGPGEGRVRTGMAESRVRFRELDTPAIDRYLASGEWRGRAGGYAIQGRGSALVAGVEGDISNVIGLPVGLLLDLVPELDG